MKCIKFSYVILHKYNFNLICDKYNIMNLKGLKSVSI